MKLWIDNVSPAPAGFIWCKSINEAKQTIIKYSSILGFDMVEEDWIELIDMSDEGGDYTKLLEWLEETGRNYPIYIHSQNPVMRCIIEKNRWKNLIIYENIL